MTREGETRTQGRTPWLMFKKAGRRPAFNTEERGSDYQRPEGIRGQERVRPEHNAYPQAHFLKSWPKASFQNTREGLITRESQITREHQMTRGRTPRLIFKKARPAFKTQERSDYKRMSDYQTASNDKRG